MHGWSKNDTLNKCERMHMKKHTVTTTGRFLTIQLIYSDNYRSDEELAI